MTALGVAYVALTLEEARATTRAAVEGAKAAFEANSDARTRFAAEQRPWLSIADIPEISLGRVNDELYLAGEVKVKNVGIGPALGIQCHAMVRYGALPIAPAYTIAQFADRAQTAAAEFANRVIFPGFEEKLVGFANDIPDNVDRYPFTFVYICITYVGQTPNEIFHTGIAVQTLSELNAAGVNNYELTHVTLLGAGVSMSIR